MSNILSNQSFSVNLLFSRQGLSGSGVMSSHKLGLISALECPCLKDYNLVSSSYQQQRSPQPELSTLEPRPFLGSAAQPVGYSGGRGGAFLLTAAHYVRFSCRIVPLILIYRHRVKNLFKSLFFYGELSLC